MSLKYRADIDGIRALAVTSVVLFHAYPSFVRGGFAGVDVFFVISGFLITSIMLQDFNENKFSFLNFYTKRIKRIFPTLIFVLISVLFMGQFILFSDELNSLSKHVMGGAGFISNFILWNESGYFDSAVNKKPLLHLWSLAIEEQFYLTWPVTLFLLWKYRINVFTATLLIAITSFILNVKGIKSDAIATFYSTHTRIWEIMVGGLLAHLWRDKERFKPLMLNLNNLLNKIIFHTQNSENTLKNFISIVGFVTIIGCMFFLKERFFPGWKALIPVLGTSLLIAAGPTAFINRLFLSNRFMVWIGLISYPLYLWHWPLISFLYIYFGETPSLALRTYAVLSSVLLAWFSYRIIEIPFKSPQSQSCNNRSIKTLYLVLIITSAFSYFQYRKTDKYTDDPFLFKPFYAKTNECLKKYDLNNLTFCVGSNLKKESSVLVIGDSHANHLFAGLKTYYKLKKEEVINWGAGTCLPFYNLNAENNGTKCVADINATLEKAIADKNLHTIILSAFYSMYTTEDVVFKSLSNPTLLNRNEIFRLSIKETLDKLIKANKKVVLFYDVPTLNFDPRDCQRRVISWFEKNKRELTNDCETNRGNLAQRNEIEVLFENIITSSPEFAKNVRIFNPRLFLCNNSKCLATKDKQIIYRDQNHLNQTGSKWLATKYDF